MKKIALTAILLLFPFQTWAGCSADGYTVIYVNGIFTSQAQAEAEQKLLQDKFEDSTGRSDVVFLSGYNPSHLAGGGDLLKSIQQAYRDEESYIDDYDLQTILLKIAPDVKTRKILLFGYSQGTFYTNALYHYLVANGVPKESIAVYNVDTPASYVAGDGQYLTSATDMLIYEVRRKAAFGGAKQPLESNILIPPVVENPVPPYPGHSLKNVYLPKATVRIISEVNTALESLEAGESTDEACFTPPPLSTDYKIKQAGFSLFDPAAEGIRTGTVYAYKGAKLVIDTAQSGLNAVGSAIRSLLPPANTATAIDAFDVVRNVYGSSLTREDLEELNSSVPSVKAKQEQDSTLYPYMGTVEETAPSGPDNENSDNLERKNVGEVLGEFIAIDPPPPPPQFQPMSPNGALVGGGGGGTPIQESAPEPEPEAVVEEPTPEPEPIEETPVSELSITTPTENESIATTTATIMGTAPAEALVEISSGSTISYVTAGDDGSWTADIIFDEGPVSISVSAFESVFNATTTLTRAFSITLPCEIPTPVVVQGNQTWSAENGPYVIDGDTYFRQGDLTIGPGTIVKFMSGAVLRVHEQVELTISGSADSPVVFTSLSDDSQGGDTNCDDTATTPAPGDWGYAIFGGGGGALKNADVSYLTVRYGGGVETSTSNDGTFYPSLAVIYDKASGSPKSYTLTGVKVSDSAHIGLYAYIADTYALTLSGSAFEGNAEYGLYRGRVVKNGNNVAGSLTATDNWWGDESGPYHETLNPEGTGDAVGPVPLQSEKIILSPWLSSTPF